MDLEVNQYLVRVAQTKADEIPIEEPMEIGDDVILTVEGSVVKTEERDNFDGTKDVLFIVKGALARKE
jgi:hypothetical protein